MLNVILALLLRGYGVEGIALALAITQIMQGIMLAVWFNKKIPGLFDYAFAEGFVKMAVASAGGAVALQFLKAPIASVVDMKTGFGVLMQGVGAGLGGLIIYYLLARFFHAPVPALAKVKKLIRRKNRTS